jgi:hypothetical protein
VRVEGWEHFFFIEQIVILFSSLFYNGVAEREKRERERAEFVSHGKGGRTEERECDKK